MVRVLLQLKVNRLCLVVDGTAGFDPNRTSGSPIWLPAPSYRANVVMASKPGVPYYGCNAFLSG